MPRYVARPRAKRAEYDEDAPLISMLFVDAPEEVWTGLLDQHGDDLYRLPSPIGFHAELEE